jgi:hypothetical protein
MDLKWRLNQGKIDLRLKSRQEEVSLMKVG